MEKITIIYPDGLELFVFIVSKMGVDDSIIWSEQADTLEEAMVLITEKELE